MLGTFIHYTRKETCSDEQRIVGSFSPDTCIKKSRDLKKAVANPFGYPNIQCVLDLKDKN